MQVSASLKLRCNKCRFVKRRKNKKTRRGIKLISRLFRVCTNPRHAGRQG